MSDAEFQVQLSNSEAADPANRLRAAVRAAGGNHAVSQRSGVPLSNLTRYLAGQDMKLQVAKALAEATNVSLDWLATGRGTMRPAAEPPAPTEAAPNPLNPPSSFVNTLDIDRFVKAIEIALKIAVADGVDNPTMHQLVRGAVIIYQDYPTPEAARDAVNALKEKLMSASKEKVR